MNNIKAEVLSFEQYNKISFPEDTFISTTGDIIIFQHADFDKNYILPKYDLETRIIPRKEHRGKTVEHYGPTFANKIKYGGFQISKSKWLFLMYGEYTWDRYAGSGRDAYDLITENFEYNILTKENIDKDLWSLIQFQYFNISPKESYLRESEFLYRKILIAYEKNHVKGAKPDILDDIDV